MVHTNDNLCQYVKVYFGVMFEIWHMDELDRVCHFVMGLLTWAKCKLEENWPSLSKAIMKVEGFSNVGQGEKSEFKKDKKFPHKKARHEREWNRKARHFKRGRTQIIPRFGFETQRKFRQERGSFKKEPTQAKC